MNSINITGRMTKDAELRQSTSGISMASFSIAVDKRTKNAEGKREADFFRCVAFRQPAEFAANYLGKGRLVAISGNLQQRTWEKDGEKKESIEIVVNNIEGLDKPKEQTESFEEFE